MQNIDPSRRQNEDKLILMMEPQFITIEGGEGVGKSTALKILGRLLREQGIPVTLTREPGGTALGEAVRELLLDTEADPPTGLAELLLIFAARAQHLDDVIKPALSQGQWVVCDRFTDATHAYQGAARGITTQYIDDLEMLVQGNLKPDKVLLLDMDPLAGLERAKRRGVLDRFEREEISFFERVRQGYLDRAVVAPERYEIINAGRDLSDVENDLARILNDCLEDV